MAGRVERPDTDVADDQHVAVVEAHVGIGRHAVTMHHRGDAEALLDLARGREMIGVGVGVDDVAQPQALARQQPDIAVDLAQRRVDQHGGAFAGTAEQIGLAAAGGVSDGRSSIDQTARGEWLAGPCAGLLPVAHPPYSTGSETGMAPGCGTTRM